MLAQDKGGTSKDFEKKTVECKMDKKKNFFLNKKKKRKKKQIKDWKANFKIGRFRM